MNQLAFPRTTFTIDHDIATQQKKYELTVDVDGEPVAEGEADHRNVESLKHEKVSQVTVCVTNDSFTMFQFFHCKSDR